MMYTDDPIADFNKWDAEQQKILDKLPRCSECDEPICDDYACFNTFSIYQVLPHLIQLLGLNTQTDVQSKKNFAALSGK